MLSIENEEKSIESIRKNKFLKVIEEMSKSAQENGLTEEILNEILAEQDKQ